MILAVDGRTWCGPVVDLRAVDVEGRAVVAAIRGETSPVGAHCPPAGEVHERAGYVRPGMGLSTRTALAAAGRSRGLEAPQDEELARLRDELATLATEGPAVAGGEGGAAPEADRERLRERVAELRGRVQALEAQDRDAGEVRRRLRDAARRLSELETERVAATERRALVRDHRDLRERRMRLEDRAANLARAARAHLVDELADEYAAAVQALGSHADVPDGGEFDDPFDADPVTAALGVLRVARVRAPVVLAVDRFEGPADAATWLEAPVVHL